MSSTATANSLLDKLLAQAATMQQKLEMMTTSPSGGVKAEEVVEAEAARDKPTGRPGAILDSCLDRALTLHIKMEKLSAEVSARWEPGHPKLPRSSPQAVSGNHMPYR